ncbi:MAG: SPOR domain-containing protein [Kastovskya adunca ATA6-11-RM4]|jgi:cell division protein FtsN|nr:SPOR domain-containing protein [Kastovskya adunca ATA6-11-RM4]
MPSVKHPRLDFSAILLVMACLGLASQYSIAQQVPPNLSAPTTQAETIILGQPCENTYVVVIPASDPKILDKVKPYRPLAFLTNSRLGWYVQAGSFSDRALAESLSYQLRSVNLDARVAYLPVRCQR